MPAYDIILRKERNWLPGKKWQRNQTKNRQVLCLCAKPGIWSHLRRCDWWVLRQPIVQYNSKFLTWFKQEITKLYLCNRIQLDLITDIKDKSTYWDSTIRFRMTDAVSFTFQHIKQFVKQSDKAIVKDIAPRK
mgnify:CR=1 FL=1